MLHHLKIAYYYNVILNLQGQPHKTNKTKGKYKKLPRGPGLGHYAKAKL
jgi:hypothetical protein